MLVFSCRGSSWLLTLLAIAILLEKRPSEAGLLPLLDSRLSTILDPLQPCLLNECGPDEALFSILCNSMCNIFVGTPGNCTNSNSVTHHKHQSGNVGNATNSDSLSAECICEGQLSIAQGVVDTLCNLLGDYICLTCGFVGTLSCGHADGNRIGASITCR